MDDHAHVLVWPEDGYALEESCRSWKSFTAHEMQRRFGRIGSVWQDESFDRIIRSEKELYGKMMYILNNHRKRWPDSRIIDGCGLKGCEITRLVDFSPLESRRVPRGQTPARLFGILTLVGWTSLSVHRVLPQHCNQSYSASTASAFFFDILNRSL